MKKLLTALILSIAFIFPSNGLVQAATFKDVPATDSKGNPFWAYDVIQEMANNHYISGYADGRFYPNQSITRADAAKALAIALQANPSPNFKPLFEDVDKNHPAYSFIAGMTELGVFNNTKKFNPNNPLTRAQMSKILTLGFDIIVDDHHEFSFKDVSPNNHFLGYITTLAEVGITTTPQGGSFKPNNPVSRAHMSAFLSRTMAFDLKREAGIITYDAKQKKYIEPALETTIDAKELKDSTVQLVNGQRKLHKAGKLQYDPKLSQIAQVKAEDMVKHNYFDHQSPTYGSVGNMLDRFNYQWKSYGENIAHGYSSADSVVTAWLNSPGHRTNILNSKFTNIGVGYAIDTDGKPYWVHLFSMK